MKIEVLLSTMNQEDFTLYDKLNLESDLLMINQCEETSFEEIIFKDKNIRKYNFNEIGVGLSRNNALMRSNGDICVMADDDMIYVDNYEDIILSTFKDIPEADMIIFNVRVHSDGKVIEKVDRNKRIRYHNCLKYGTVSFVFKKESVYKKNIFFSLLFGGGAKYSAGEDSLFIWECLKKGLKIYSCKEVIADVYNFNSSWFKGYNKKYFLDKGIFFNTISPLFAKIFAIRFALTRNKIYSKDISIKKSIKYMFEGINLN